MKRKITKTVLLGSLLVIVAACGGGVGGSSSDDWGEGIAEVEPNDTSGTAQTITAGVTINGTGNDSTDFVDYYQFVPTETKIYTVKLGGMGSNDFDLYVDDGYTDVHPDTDAPGDGPTETIEITLAAGTTYYIVVSAVDTGMADGDYRVKIE